jgi:hypothetical protein
MPAMGWIERTAKKPDARHSRARASMVRRSRILCGVGERDAGF